MTFELSTSSAFNSSGVNVTNWPRPHSNRLRFRLVNLLTCPRIVRPDSDPGDGLGLIGIIAISCRPRSGNDGSVTCFGRAGSGLSVTRSIVWEHGGDIILGARKGAAEVSAWSCPTDYCVAHWVTRSSPKARFDRAAGD